MSIAEEVGVKITGDASGATGAFKVSEEAAGRALSKMMSWFREIGLVSKESMAVVGEASKHAAHEVEESETIIGRATERMKEHIDGVKEHYETVTGFMGKLNTVMIGAMALLAGGEGFEKAIEKTNELAAENLKLSKTFGISLEQASGMHSALAKFGIDLETVTGAVQKMDRQVKTNEPTLNKMGVQTRDASGALLNQLDIFMNGIEALRGYKEGTDRNIAAQTMFGRGVGNVGALLKLNRAELEEGAESARKLGLITDQEGVESMKRYKIAINETKEVFEAIMVAIGKRVLPVLTELAEYIKNNGETVMERLAIVLDVLGLAFTVVGQVIAAFIAVATALYDHALEPLLRIADDLAVKLRDVLASAVAFVMGHLDELRAVATTLAGVLVTGLAAAAGYYATVMLSTAIPATIAFARALFTEVLPGLYATITSLLTGIIPALGTLAESLALNIVRMIALDAVNPVVWIGAAVGVVAALAAGFAAWLGWLDPIIAKMKQLWDWTTKFLGLDKAFKAFTGGDAPATHATAAPATLGTKSAAGLIKEPKEQKEKAPKEKKADEPTDEYMAWIKIRDEARKKSAKVAIDLANIEAKGERDAELAKIDADEESAKRAFDLGKISKQQLLQLELKFAADRLAIKLKSIADEVAAEKAGPDDPVKLATLNQQRLVALRAFEAAKTKIEADAEAQRTQRTRTAITSIASSWSSALAKMATLQASFGATIESLWQGVAGMISGALTQVIQDYITKWLSSLLVKKAAQAADGATTVASESGKAGAGGVASMAAAPFPLNLGAPAFGASMAAAALAFAPAASAMGGWDVPAGFGSGIDGRGGMSAIIHPREMVLPADLADKVRSGGSGGDTYHIHATDADSFVKMLHANRGDVARAVKAAVRFGVRD